MQCKCGGEAKSSKAENGACKARLVFRVCSACQRVSDADLFIQDVRVSFDLPGDPVARNQFNVMTKDLAKELYAGAVALQAVLREVSREDENTSAQGALF